MTTYLAAAVSIWKDSKMVKIGKGLQIWESKNLKKKIAPPHQENIWIFFIRFFHELGKNYLWICLTFDL
ncbi:MAG: hypothetical protein CMB97_01630 [Flavobacteriaceae bacterium]|nr:hypothetical protein [Flavobacteriaceae bacterium]